MRAPRSRARNGRDASGSLSPEERALLERWEATKPDVLDSRSTSDTIRSVIADAIGEGGLPPGWPLREEWLAAVFDVSRTPIREALFSLANSNLVARDARGSLRVGSVTADEVQAAYAVIEALDGLAAATAAEVASPRDIAHLRELNRLFARAAEVGDFGEAAIQNRRLHAAISEISGNPFLTRFTKEIQAWVNRVPSILSYPGRAQATVGEHERIIDAIEQHDAERAEQLVREHMREAGRIRVETLRTESR
jgi:DNA-binding GntR family transcriptional regulator